MSEKGLKMEKFFPIIHLIGKCSHYFSPNSSLVNYFANSMVIKANVHVDF